MNTDNTLSKHSGLVPWRPGQSGNPAGRPRGSRSKLGEAFVEALQADFQAHGPAAVVKVREEDPGQYLKVIASVIPKELHIKDATLEDMSDNELIDVLDAVKSFIAANGTEQTRKRVRSTARDQDAGSVTH